MREVLHQAFVVGAFRGAITAAGKPGAPVDEDGILASSQYYERVGRWRASSLKISKSVALRAIMAAVHKVHLQIERMMSFFQSVEHEFGSWLELIWHRNATFRSEFFDLARAVAWRQFMSELDPHIDAKKLAGFILCHVCQAYCDYERRIGLKCVCYPKRAFILCVGSPMGF